MKQPFSIRHTFWIFSVFNPDAIKDLKLYKGGIPARYGGRASSVLDIYQKMVIVKNFINGGIKLISSRILAEGPLVKTKDLSYRWSQLLCTFVLETS
jgi:hypothetical protein